jgi:osmotically-inducible protein OsmY
MIRRIAVLCVIGALAGAGAACSTGPNPSEQVRSGLKAANLNDVNVEWDSSARIAHLKGTVDRPTDRQRAEDIATATVGTTGTVLNEVTIKGLNDTTAGNLDSAITSQLKKMRDVDPILRDRDIDFDVNNGVVTVKGEVRTAEEKNKVTELVRAAPGVKDMANALEIKPPKN